MGYTLELWAADPNGVVRELTSPTLAVDDADTEGIHEETVERWDECAALVAGGIAEGGGELVGEVAHYVLAVVRTLGTFYGSLDHTSAGGDDFRDEFLAGPATERFGAELVDHLVDRPLAGLRGFEYPSFGWVSPEEVQAVVDRADGTPPPEVADHHAGQLHVLDGTLRRCARFGLGIVTAYV